MREHIENLIAALMEALRPGTRGTDRPIAAGRRQAVRVVPARRRRPRVARSTYTPVRRDFGRPVRFAH